MSAVLDKSAGEHEEPALPYADDTRHEEWRFPAPERRWRSPGDELRTLQSIAAYRACFGRVYAEQGPYPAAKQYDTAADAYMTGTEPANEAQQQLAPYNALAYFLATNYSFGEGLEERIAALREVVAGVGTTATDDYDRLA